MTHAIKWTFYMENQLREMWDTSVPLAVIAAHFGLGESAVSTKKARMGLPPRDARHGAAMRWKNHVSKPEKLNAFTVKLALPYAPKPKHPEIMNLAPLTTRTGCAFPIERDDVQWLFCNCTITDESAYCHIHQVQMYQPNWRKL